MKGLVFSEQCVRGMLNGTKTRFLLPVTPQPGTDDEIEKEDDGLFHYVLVIDGKKDVCPFTFKTPCNAGQKIAVKEVWRPYAAHRYEADARIEYRAGGPSKKVQFPGKCSDSIMRTEYDAFIEKMWSNRFHWHPSLTMPMFCTRIVLNIKNVCAAPIQTLQEEDAKLCGFTAGARIITGGPWGVEDDPDEWTAVDDLHTWWNDRYGDKKQLAWESNPWIWIVDFNPELISESTNKTV